MEAWLQSLLATLALPEHGLSTVFVVAFVSATLLPLGSEPAVFGLVKLNADLFWPAILVATAGNTIGGAISWAMGLLADRGGEIRSGHARRPAFGKPVRRRGLFRGVSGWALVPRRRRARRPGH